MDISVRDMYILLLKHRWVVINYRTDESRHIVIELEHPLSRIDMQFTIVLAPGEKDNG